MSQSVLSQLPVIDPDGVDADVGKRKRMLAAIRCACEEIDFFNLANHGVAEAILDEAWTEARAFFALPRKLKMALAVTRERYRGYIPLAAFRPMMGTARPIFTRATSSIWIYRPKIL